MERRGDSFKISTERASESESESKQSREEKRIEIINDGRNKDAANIVEAHREGDSAPSGVAEHRRQLQPRRQGHSQTGRRCLARELLQRHRRRLQQLCSYVPNPVLVIIDVQPKELGIPTKAYFDVEEVKENATQKSQKIFVHVPSEIAAHEVEEIGVEHLLRDVKDTTISTLATEVTGKLTALKGLDARLREIRGYLDLVIDEKLPLNHEILYHLQDIFNLLPNLNVTELIKGFAVKTNDMMLVIYLSSLIRSVIALHNLINNKMLNKEHEKAEDAKPAAVPAVSGS
ncbi:Rpn11/EIF3F, C-terminal [Trema orientale]|uniref:Rpn11/EIF3F, C-terminal n=1 Tax=Trema orientale TaxID=63057 RepID=A0A2P5F4F0_TREOI|nr:Rpn11/EIF3F, C-terminal [Trema orientale]